MPKKYFPDYLASLDVDPETSLQPLGTSHRCPTRQARGCVFTAEIEMAPGSKADIWG